MPVPRRGPAFGGGFSTKIHQKNSPLDIRERLISVKGVGKDCPKLSDSGNNFEVTHEAVDFIETHEFEREVNNCFRVTTHCLVSSSGTSRPYLRRPRSDFFSRPISRLSHCRLVELLPSR
jgi:hypothetical protein